MATTGFAARLGLAAALAVAAPLALAPIAPAAAQMGIQVPLTTASVEAFISSYPAIKAAADGLKGKYGIDDGDDDPASAWGVWMTATAAWAELNALVTPYGFANFQQWLQNTISIATAFGFAKAGGAIDAGMAAAMAQIQNNPAFTAAQKEMMLQQLSASMGAMGALRPPQANIDAVQPYLAQLAILFDG